MSTSHLHIKHLIAILAFSVALLTSGCNSSSSGSGETVALSDPDGVLASIDVTSIEELKQDIEEKGAIGFVLHAVQQNPDIESEHVVRLLHANNQNIEYQALAQQSVPEEVVAKLKKLRITPKAVENLVQLPSFKLVDREAISDQALAFLNQQKLRELNKQLALNGQALLTLEEFEQLQSAFESVDMKDNYGDLGQSFQNLIVKDTRPVTSSAARSAPNARSVSATIPSGFRLLNPSDEQQALTPDSPLPFENSACSLTAELSTFPLSISTQGEAVESALVSSDGSNALMHFPESGIALIQISNTSASPLRVIKDDGTVLFDGSVDSGDTLYLPVLSSDRCDPFTFEGASNSYDIAILDMFSSQRLSDRAFIEGSEYLQSDDAEVINDHFFFNARSYSFALFNSRLDSLNFLFGLNTSASTNSAFDVLVYSPSGKVYRAGEMPVENGYQSFTSLSGQSVPIEPGVWRIDILPGQTTSVDNQQLSEISAKKADGIIQGFNLNVRTLVSVDAESQGKEFVLGTMKTLSFTSDGEDDASNEGEISTTLNTSMAPPIEIPSLLDRVINDETGTLDDEEALWQCWEKSEKTGFEMESDGNCHAYREIYYREKRLLEDQADYASVEIIVYEDGSSDRIPLFERCPRNMEQYGDSSGMCEKGIGQPYGVHPRSAASEDLKARVVLKDFAKRMKSRYSGDEALLYALSTHYDLYASWVARAVQVETGTFPSNRIELKTRDQLPCDTIDGELLGCDLSNYNIHFDAPVVIEANRPIFGVPVERVNESTDPITFDYVASDGDEYDADAELFAVLGFIASQSLNIVTGNFMGMICGTVDLTDDLHQLELDAEDDPVGSAKVSINRFSSRDPFYGLHTEDAFQFYMSGVPEENTQVDTHGQKINYAQIACGVANLATSGAAFTANADFLLSLDYEALGSHADMVAMIGAISIATDGAIIASDADEIATLIRSGDFEAAKARLKTSSNINHLTTGVDLYTSPADLLGHYSDQGSAANGNNIIKTNAQYLLEGEDKTRAGVSFERVSSAQVTSIDVVLDSVKIISNYESSSNADGAEVILAPFVGEINDADYNRHPYEPHTVFQNTVSDPNGWSNLKYNGVEDGDILTPNTSIYNFEQSRNAAALYLELAILEDDGLSIEDDDMIGVFSQTLKLEEIYNKGEFEWTLLGGNDYQLKIQEYPVYNSSNQRVLENPLSDSYEQQKNHNRKRSPSALVSLTVNVTLSDATPNYPKVDTGLNPNDINPGKDTYSMEMSQVNELDISTLSNPEIHDIYLDRIILTKEESMGREGIIYSYDATTSALAELFSFDLDSFSGDLLPIKEALVASKSIGSTHPWGSRNEENIRYKDLPLFKLLSNNRLLFVITTDAGAKIMIVSYNNQGDMSLVSSLDIEDDESNPISIVGKSSLSPNRSGLLIPTIPESYLGSDKLEAPHTSVLYYTLDDTSIRYQNIITDPYLTIASVEFINDTALAIQLGEFKYVQDSGITWDQLGEFKQNLHHSCSSTNLSCYFALYDRKVRIYSIDKSDPLSQDLDLAEEIHNVYEPYHAGYTTYRSANQIRNYLFESPAYFQLETVSLTDRTAVLRANSRYFELTLDDRVNAFIHSGTFVLSSHSRIRHNALGHYYCAEGLVCSGYMQDALKPKSDDENSFTSDIRINDFEFADKQRDLVAAIVAGENTGDDLRLALLSLYDGAAFKGPQISGAIFDSEVLINGADDKVRWPFEFTVTDRDTRIDQLHVSVSGLTTETTLPAHNSATSSPDYTASCSTDANGDGLCSGEILADFYNAKLKQTITVSVSDGVYTSKRNFTIHVDREAPLLENVSQTISLKNAGAYKPIALTIASINAADNCSVSSYCYLQQNGFVDSWSVSGTPSWLSCNTIDGDNGNKLLQCSGLPPLGAEGTYQVQVTASNTQGSDTKTLSITVEAPDVTPAVIHFVNTGDAELDTLLESNTVTVSGITGYVSLSVSGGEYWRSSTNSWSSAAASNIVNGEMIKLRVTSSSHYSSDQSVNLTLAGILNTFTVTTKADPFIPDTSPDAFSFTALTEQLANDVVESNSVTITGINQAVDISISAGEYRVGTGSWTSASGSVESGDTVQLRHTTSTEYSTQVSSTLTVGDVSASFASTTQAIPLPELTAGMGITNPTLGDAFSFTPTNIGGEVSTWSVSNKPEWASFNSATGELSGTVTSSDNFTLSITASNASGSDTFTSQVTVFAAQAPYLNDANCNIDDDTCDFSFTDAALWRASINSVVLTESHGGPEIATLSTPEDYELSNGQLRLHFNATNNLPKSAGEWGNAEFEVKLTANNFNDVQARFYLSEGATSISSVSVMPPIESGVVSTISLRATNRFGAPVRKFYPTITVDNDNSDVGALTEVYQYRQASDFGDSNIWKDFGNYNELSADENGDASFDFKTPGCVDLNDGFTLAINDYHLIHTNSDGDCVEAEWTIREEAYDEQNNNIALDGQQNLYRVTKESLNSSGSRSLLNLSKYDRNGQRLWTKALTAEGSNWFVGIEFVDNSLIVAGSSNVDVDEEGEAVSLGEFDVFAQRVDLEGNVTWTRQVGTATPDYLQTLTVSNGLIYLQAKINTQANMSGDVAMYRMDLNGNSLQQLMAGAEAFEHSLYSHAQVDANGNFYLLADTYSSSLKGLKKFNSAGVVTAANASAWVDNITDMLLVDDAIYLTMNVTESDTLEGETWNANEASAVRVMRLRTSDLTVVWSHLIQSDATYTGLSNSNGQLAHFNDVVYVSVVANQELYYQGLALDKTPNYSLNLLAFNADGAEDGTSGNTNAQGEILSHQSWLSGPKHASDSREDPYLAHKEMAVSSTGWLYMSFNGKQTFNSSAQLGRNQSAPYNYKTNSLILKTQLDATPFSLLMPQTGLTRNAYFKVVTDHDNGLQWIDDSTSHNSYSTWVNANDACTSRTWPGTGWRLPTPVEMERAGHIPVAGSVFEYYQEASDETYYYWSNEQSEAGWHVAMAFIEGFGDAFPDTDALYFRCVKSIP